MEKDFSIFLCFIPQDVRFCDFFCHSCSNIYYLFITYRVHAHICHSNLC